MAEACCWQLPAGSKGFFSQIYGDWQSIISRMWRLKAKADFLSQMNYINGKDFRLSKPARDTRLKAAEFRSDP
jgi:hypothetical protein